MKILMTIMLAVFTLTGVIDNIATVNRLKKEAEEAFKAKEYTKAIKNYNLLLDSLEVKDENIRANLAHAYLMSGDTTAAQQNYTQLINSDNEQVKSMAYQQLGIVNADQKKYKEALSFFKESLKADPTNEEARYNYELVKKLLEQQQKNQQQNQDQQQQNKENKDQQQQDGEQKQDQQNQEGEDQQQKEQQREEGQQNKENKQQGEQGEQEEQKPEQPNEQQQQEGQEQQDGEKNKDEQSMPSVSDKLKEMNISEEKAQMILDAMRNSEMQYIQQNRRKVTQPRDKSKPDW